MTDLQQVIYNIKETHKQRQDLIRTVGQLNLRVEANYRRYTAIWATQHDVPKNVCSKPTGMTKLERNRFEKALAGEHGQLDTLRKDIPGNQGECEEVSVHGLSSSAVDAYFFALELAKMHSEPYRRAINGTAVKLADGAVHNVPGLQYDLDLLTKKLEALAKDLPVYQWALSCRGLGVVSLGQIIGESGDLSNYATVSRVWKRLGLAVINGQRQRNTTNKELAIEFGYDAERRAIMWVVGDNLIRAGNPTYKPFYDAEKVRLAEKWPEATKMHIHRAAHRHMEKEFLIDLWREWNLSMGEALGTPKPLASAA